MNLGQFYPQSRVPRRVTRLPAFYSSGPMVEYSGIDLGTMSDFDIVKLSPKLDTLVGKVIGVADDVRPLIPKLARLADELVPVLPEAKKTLREARGTLTMAKWAAVGVAGAAILGVVIWARRSKRD